MKIKKNTQKEKIKEFEKKIDQLKESKHLWELFTRKEEYDAILHDRYDRFPAYMSSRGINVLVPEVSEFIIKNNMQIEYPENRKFAICLTHDVDVLQIPKVEIVIDAVKSLYHFQITETLRKSFYHLNNEYNPLWNFREIMALEENYDAKSSFYFMGLDKGDQDFNYRLEDLRSEMGNILNQGWEIGLHGGHKAFNNIEVLKNEKDRLEAMLGKRVIGFRSHYLRFKTPDTWELLKEAGFRYDTTFGYGDCVGFRNGMCHPFKPFNLNTNTRIDILEIPLALMEFTLGDTYMRLDAKMSWEVAKNLIDITEKNGGVFTVLWHNTSMMGDELRLYRKILDYGREKNAWMTSGKEIFEYWDKNM